MRLIHNSRTPGKKFKFTRKVCDSIDWHQSTAVQYYINSEYWSLYFESIYVTAITDLHKIHTSFILYHTFILHRLSIKAFICGLSASSLTPNPRQVYIFTNVVVMCTLQYSWMDPITSVAPGNLPEHSDNMMTSSNENIFRVTGPLCGEFTGHRRISPAKASDAVLWYFLWSALE